MKTETFHLELITPCLCGGAEPERQAEIRAPSIRGHLRWWLRTLGGLKSLEGQMDVRGQESLIFGSTAGGDGRAGRLAIQIRPLPPHSLRSGERKNLEDLHADQPFDPRGYLWFPLRKQGEDPRRRGVLDRAQPAFELRLNFRGSHRPWPDMNSMTADLRALLSIFGHLGSLGFRSRRAAGALHPKAGGTLVPLDIASSLKHFIGPSNIVIKELDPGSPAFGGTLAAENRFRDAYNADPAHRRNSIPLLDPRRMDVASMLGIWLRAWRQHGQMNVMWSRWATSPAPIPPYQKDYHRSLPGFPTARRDHNEGLASLGFPAGSSPGSAATDPEEVQGREGETFRPALGLPIIQSFSSLRPRKTVNWGTAPKGANDSEGRFASPVLLRPHRDAQGRWHALVIFVDAHRWPDGKKVYLNGQAREVAMVTLPNGTRSPELYEAMKADPALKSFP